MLLLRLASATTGVSLIAGWCLIGATPWGQPQTPAIMLPHGGEGLCVRQTTVWWTCRTALHEAPSTPPITAQRVARFDHYHARNCLPP